MHIFRQQHPELNTLLAAHAGDRNQMTESSLHLYLTTSTDAEDRNGWYTRGAMQSAHWAAYERLLFSLDIYTTQERSSTNFVRAREVARGLAGFAELTGHSRAIFLGQMARMNHGGRFNAMYLGNRDTGSPFHSMIVPHSVTDVRTLYSQIWAHSSRMCQKVRASLSNWTNNYLSTQSVTLPDAPAPEPTAATAIELFIPALSSDQIALPAEPEAPAPAAAPETGTSDTADDSDGE